MRSIDLSPLYRTAIGYDHVLNLLESASRGDSKNTGYPPYNIEVIESDKYQITLAVAGFSKNEIQITSERNKLNIKGKHVADHKERKFLHQGIAGRDFERTFELAEHVRVVGADLENGLLKVDLVKEIPEAMKPKKIEIGTQIIDA
ncbi:heat-shock protein [Oleiphilus sp. HI0009]|nr:MULTISPECIES: Hsp20 family protein [unclassified Oleiphilus]KZX74946.1 heat-shock protein [Oleiphilus sp. HI0009]MCH2159203.1 Hsp20 family protein [Oleiphilaceae bacterium]KZY65822.1 heat-shock protein [Oleiphilus sp. HI0066]KZY69472.1 heat-shock protein [Oleiphilus sp. HI0066]KZY72031.1 heat-shock protein [Oleiphilus sp. HI0067]